MAESDAERARFAAVSAKKMLEGMSLTEKQRLAAQWRLVVAENERIARGWPHSKRWGVQIGRFWIGVTYIRVKPWTEV